MNTARLDMSSPELVQAVADVRSDTTPTTFCIFGYEGKAKIVLQSKGTSTWAFLDELDEAAACFVLLRVEGGRDQESKTAKFVFITYCGPGVGGMARAFNLPGPGPTGPHGAPWRCGETFTSLSHWMCKRS